MLVLLRLTKTMMPLKVNLLVLLLEDVMTAKASASNGKGYGI
jgi:hypothetical protein